MHFLPRGSFFLSILFGLTSVAIPHGVSPASAEPPDISLAGQTLTFVTGDNVAYSDLPFDYLEPVLYLADDCLRARLSAVSRTPNGDIVIDGNSSESIDPYIDDSASNRPPGVESSAIVTLDFLFDSGCDNADIVPAVVTDVCINVKDIDEGQFAQFKNPDRYTLDAQSVLSIASESGGFLRATETENREEGTDGDDQKFWLQVEYDRTSSVTLGVGISDKATADHEGAIFDVVFGCVRFSNPVERVPSAGFSGPDINLDHYLERAAEAENALPDTK